jgi:organic radical activating enzyme
MSRAFTNNLLKEQSLEDGEIFEGDLVKEGKATWTCDSTSQWLWRGEDKEFDYLINRWKEEGVYQDIKDGTVHIIWTGGEPTIKGHQEAIINFTNYWMSRYLDVNNVKPFYEIETNGTIVIDVKLFNMLDQINCSPKLANSGMTEKQRINPEAIERIKLHKNYQFKFVISTEEDVKEIFRDFVVPFNIPLKHVVAMPGMDSRDDFHERTQFCLEMAKKYRFRGMTRLHLSAWDKTLNV